MRISQYLHDVACGCGSASDCVSDLTMSVQHARLILLFVPQQLIRSERPWSVKSISVRQTAIGLVHGFHFIVN